MDIAGTVTETSSSSAFHVGDHVVAPGAVGYSDGCSFQTHVLVSEETCAKVCYLERFLACHPSQMDAENRQTETNKFTDGRYRLAKICRSQQPQLFHLLFPLLRVGFT
jgi:hypothetical protein